MYLVTHRNPLWRVLSVFIVLILTLSLILSPSASYAQALNLPVPGTMVTPTPAYVPALLKGMTVYPDNPLKFDFIVDSGNWSDHRSSIDDQRSTNSDPLKKESKHLIKYFLASLTVPQDELWVNLSPREKDRIVPDALGRTELGRDLLAQDYLLKQLTASLMYPEDDLGRKFWQKIYKEAYAKYGTTDIPVDTFNKVWIIPESATVYENGNTVYVVESKLKVMLEQDYLSSQKSVASSQGKNLKTDNSPLATQIVRELILPAIEKEVNEGQTFAPLRQIYNSLILAKWYKDTVKNSILSQVYVDQNKTAGITNDDPKMKEKIYAQYMAAYKKGVYNYIKDEYDPATKDIIPRKYFSGGFEGKSVSIHYTTMTTDKAMAVGEFKKIKVDLMRVGRDATMNADLLMDEDFQKKFIEWIRERTSGFALIRPNASLDKHEMLDQLLGEGLAAVEGPAVQLSERDVRILFLGKQWVNSLEEQVENLIQGPVTPIFFTDMRKDLGEIIEAWNKKTGRALGEIGPVAGPLYIPGSIDEMEVEASFIFDKYLDGEFNGQGGLSDDHAMAESPIWKNASLQKGFLKDVENGFNTFALLRAGDTAEVDDILRRMEDEGFNYFYGPQMEITKEEGKAFIQAQKDQDVLNNFVDMLIHGPVIPFFIMSDEENAIERFRNLLSDMSEEQEFEGRLSEILSPDSVETALVESRFVLEKMNSDQAMVGKFLINKGMSYIYQTLPWSRKVLGDIKKLNKLIWDEVVFALESVEEDEANWQESDKRLIENALEYKGLDPQNEVSESARRILDKMNDPDYVRIESKDSVFDFINSVRSGKLPWARKFLRNFDRDAVTLFDRILNRQSRKVLEAVVVIGKNYKESKKTVATRDRALLKKVIGLNEIIDFALKNYLSRDEMVEGLINVVRREVKGDCLYAARELGDMRTEQAIEELKSLAVSAQDDLREIAVKYLEKNELIDAYIRAILRFRDLKTVRFANESLIRLLQKTKIGAQSLKIVGSLWDYADAVLEDVDTLKAQKEKKPLSLGEKAQTLVRLKDLLEALETFPQNSRVMKMIYKARAFASASERQKAMFNALGDSSFDILESRENKQEIFVEVKDRTGKLVGYAFARPLSAQDLRGINTAVNRKKTLYQTTNVLDSEYQGIGIRLAMRWKLMQEAEKMGYRYFAFRQIDALNEQELTQDIQDIFGKGKILDFQKGLPSQIDGAYDQYAVIDLEDAAMTGSLALKQSVDAAKVDLKVLDELETKIRDNAMNVAPLEFLSFGPAAGLGIAGILVLWQKTSNATWMPETLNWSRKLVIEMDDVWDDIVKAIKKIARYSDDEEGDIVLLERLLEKYESHKKEKVRAAAQLAIERLQERLALRAEGIPVTTSFGKDVVASMKKGTVSWAVTVAENYQEHIKKKPEILLRAVLALAKQYKKTGEGLALLKSIPKKFIQENLEALKEQLRHTPYLIKGHNRLISYAAMQGRHDPERFEKLQQITNPAYLRLKEKTVLLEDVLKSVTKNESGSVDIRKDRAMISQEKSDVRMLLNYLRVVAGLHTTTGGREYENVLKEKGPEFISDIALELAKRNIVPVLDNVQALKMFRARNSESLVGFFISNERIRAKQAVTLGANILFALENLSEETIRYLKAENENILIMTTIAFDEDDGTILEEIESAVQSGVDGIQFKPFDKFVDKSFSQADDIISQTWEEYPELLISGAGGIFESRVKNVLSMPEHIIAAIGLNAQDIEGVRAQAERYRSEVDSAMLSSLNKVVKYLALRDSLPEKADLIIVLGNNETQGPLAAAQLYKKGVAKKVMVSGGAAPHLIASTPLEEREAIKFKKILMDNGVPESDIIVETESFNTELNIKNTKKILADQNILHDSVILIQFPIGQRMAVEVFKKNFGFTPISYPAYIPDVSSLKGEKLLAVVRQAFMHYFRLYQYGPQGAGIIGRVVAPKKISEAAEVLRELLVDLEAENIEIEKDQEPGLARVEAILRMKFAEASIFTGLITQKNIDEAVEILGRNHDFDVVKKDNVFELVEKDNAVISEKLKNFKLSLARAIDEKRLSRGQVDEIGELNQELLSGIKAVFKDQFPGSEIEVVNFGSTGRFSFVGNKLDFDIASVINVPEPDLVRGLREIFDREILQKKFRESGIAVKLTESSQDGFHEEINSLNLKGRYYVLQFDAERLQDGKEFGIDLPVIFDQRDLPHAERGLSIDYQKQFIVKLNALDENAALDRIAQIRLLRSLFQGVKAEATRKNGGLTSINSEQLIIQLGGIDPVMQTLKDYGLDENNAMTRVEDVRDDFPVVRISAANDGELLESVSQENWEKMVLLAMEYMEMKKKGEFDLVELISRVNNRVAPGGIDMNDIDVKKWGEDNVIEFNQGAFDEIIQSEVEGFAPIIIDIVPIYNILPLLGLVDKDKDGKKLSEKTSIIAKEPEEKV